MCHWVLNKNACEVTYYKLYITMHCLFTTAAPPGVSSVKWNRHQNEQHSWLEDNLQRGLCTMNVANMMLAMYCFFISIV